MNMSNRLNQDYCFSIHAEVEPRIVGEVPGGIRIDLGYKSGGEVTVKSGMDSKLENYFEGGVSKYAGETKIGAISSGQDWIFIATVGDKTMAEFDGRVTIRFNKRKAEKGEED